MPSVKTHYDLHVQVPMEEWKRFKELFPEYGVTSIIIKRFIRHLIIAAEEGETSITIDVKSLRGY